MRLDTGNVLAAKMNSHRHQWNGTICSQPQSWNCGAELNFRSSFCDAGSPRCFHLDVFRPEGPRFITPDSSVLEALQLQPGLLDDQILVFYGGRFGAQEGIAQGDYEKSLFGFYRVRQVQLDHSRMPRRLVIEPHDDGVVLFPHQHLRPPALRSVPGVAYLKQMRAKGLRDSLEEALDGPKSELWTADMQVRLEAAQSSLPEWLELAEQARARLPLVEETPKVSVSFGSALESPIAAKLRGIKIVTAAESEPVAVSEDAVSVDGVALAPARGRTISDRRANLIVSQTGGDTSAILPLDSNSVPEPEVLPLLEAQFGPLLVESLRLAFWTKGLVILTGAPGAGKSWIASRLLEDPLRERSVIVPVASTWRGREDLLGYVNPINGQFEATEFTHFLCDAQAAWDAGDRRPRLVVFEEFNLSQPEHWMSDLLVRLEYAPEQVADRTVHLGGTHVSGCPGHGVSVVLVPSLRFVATLNNDHTVKPLSPRVLDRAALIEVTSSGRTALVRAGLSLGEEVDEVIDELNDLLEPRGAAFSVRSARSLQRALERGASGHAAVIRSLDLVLLQEVLSRVRLLAGDPRDEQLLTRLQSWTQKSGTAGLTRCAARVADWADLLSAGRDVFQA